jgi:putative tricarboxylic transport membrane protein
MEFGSLFAGIGDVFTVSNLAFALLGCVLGMLVGVLPGFGPAAAVSLLIPVTFALPATTAIITLSAILYGAAYGGTTTAVLLNIPGEASSIATTLDGYQMAKKGRGGPALVIAAIASFVGGLIGVLGFVLVAPFSKLALEFGAPELFWVAVLGMCLITSFVGGSPAKALFSMSIGLAVATVGLDPGTGTDRFTFGLPSLYDGISLVAVVMGCFGLSELLGQIHSSVTGKPRLLKVGRLLPTKTDLRRSGLPFLRGSVIGFFMGLLPGSPGAATSLASYAAERRLSKHPEQFGKGAVEGVAGPEAANNALAISSMIPLFTLGIPTSATVAIMAGAFTINGLIPGPLLFRDHPQVAWAIIGSFVVGNAILLILNVPLARVWIAILKIPFHYLMGFILAFMFLGTYSINGNVFDIFVMLGAGVVGYVFNKLDIPLTPLVLALILGPMLEENFQRALSLSRGDFGVLVSGPISQTLLGVSVLAVLLGVIRPLLRAWFVRRRTAMLATTAAPAPTKEFVS